MSKTVFTPNQLGFPLRGGRHITPVFEEATWRPPALADLPSWKGARRIGFDTETKDPRLNKKMGPGFRDGARMVGISFAIEDGPKYYLPFGHEDGIDNLPPPQVLAYFRDQFKEFDGDLVGANLSYDLDAMWSAKIPMPKVRRFMDVQVADPLIWEHHLSYSLNAIAERRELGGKNEAMLRRAAEEMHLDPKADMWRMPARYVGPYAEDDADLPLKILRKQEKEMDEMGLLQAWDMECRLLPILVRMTMRGVRVNMQRLERIARWCDENELAAVATIKRETGVIFPDQGGAQNTKCIGALADAIGIKLGSTLNGKVSTAADAFDGVDHPAAKAMLVIKKMCTFRSTFVNGTRDHVVGRPGEERMHCTFNQIRKTDDKTGEMAGVKFGRLSSSHVNMQNQPGSSRSAPGDSSGHMWRSIYYCDGLWNANDLKQQEPRWTYHFAKLAKLKGGAEVCQMLCDNPMMDSYMPIVEIAGVTRGTAKIVWLSSTYGKSDGNLAGTPPPFGLGMPTWLAVWDRQNRCHCPADSERGQQLRREGAHVYKRPGPEAQAVIDNINEGAPFLKGLQKMAAKKAETVGYVTLLSGRRCNFEKDARGDYEQTYAALNRVIQGQASEQTKEIMIAVSDAGYDDCLLLQVHDELDNQVESETQAKAIAEVMAHAVPMAMPTIVDCEIGPSWGESMDLEYKDEDGKTKKRRYVWEFES